MSFYSPSKDISMEGLDANIGHSKVLWWEAMRGDGRHKKWKLENQSALLSLHLQASVHGTVLSYGRCGSTDDHISPVMWDCCSYSWSSQALEQIDFLLLMRRHCLHTPLNTLPKYLLILKLILQAVYNPKYVSHSTFSTCLKTVMPCNRSQVQLESES